jgi:hypothetical protein
MLQFNERGWYGKATQEVTAQVNYPRYDIGVGGINSSTGKICKRNTMTISFLKYS